MKRALAILSLAFGPATLRAAEDLDALLAAYATQPQGYASSPEYAQPDRSSPFRWHSFNDEAIARFDDVRMIPHISSHNPLEKEGVSGDPKSDLKWGFVREHVSEGEYALKLTVPAAAIKTATAKIGIKAVAGGPSLSQYLRARGMMNTASCYGPHFRWIKLDAFNPQAHDVRVRVAGVPFVLHPGKNLISVRTVDAVDRGYGCLLNTLTIEIVPPSDNATLFFDHLHLEQEKPAVLGERGLLFQFPGRADVKDPPVMWPGFTAIDNDTLYSREQKFGWLAESKKRYYGGHSFRSMESGILWGHCSGNDTPLRIDVPNGRYGVFVFGAPTASRSTPVTMSVNGRPHVLLTPQGDAELRRLALSGETLGFRPGVCVWEQLVRPVYYPAMAIAYVEAVEGRLLLEFPAQLALHALVVFPESDKDAALEELGRLNYLLAESWDVSHPWVRGDYARQVRYIGLHDEMLDPSSIAKRLRSLQPTEQDWQRGFLLFQRGLTEPIYPDSIPTAQETAIKELRCAAVAGQHECVTLGFLPLKTTTGLRLFVTDLVDKQGQARIPAGAIDVRISRYHQKTMQFGHHNHDYNYAEQYLVRRPVVDLCPGAARRAYFDVAVPHDASAGEYRGAIAVQAANGETIAKTPFVLEVLPIHLEKPPVFFASSLADVRLKDYGFNTFPASWDEAIKNGYKGYLANCGYGLFEIKGKKIGWNNFLDNKEVLAPMLEAGRTGKGPRGFFGGPAPGTHSSPDADNIARQFFDKIRQELPAIDLPGRTFPAFYHGGYQGLQTPHEWIYLAAPAQSSMNHALAKASMAGGEFWFIDGLRHDKEQAGRFTFGFWLWRLGATARYTTLEAALQYGGGTARSTLRWHPYFTLLDVTTCNIDRALMDSLDEKQSNPSRDLILLRSGIDDFRYIHTLDVCLARARTKDSPEVVAARKYRDELAASLALDLTHYYEARAGAYGENWQPRADNPWTDARFNQVRRQVAEHILALAGRGASY